MISPIEADIQQQLAMLGVAVEDWGLIPYQEAFDRQKKYVDEIIAGGRQETLVFCSHPPTVTRGRGTKEGDVTSAWSGATVEVNRGGRATYHGPSQMVFYPLISVDTEDSKYSIKAFRARDLHEFLRRLEQAMVATLKKFGITSQAHSEQQQVGEDRSQEATGVWVQDQKIAAIGISVKKWVVSHGIALNVDEDPQAFQGIFPCGFLPRQVISMESLLNKKIEKTTLKNIFLSEFAKIIFNLSQPSLLGQ